MKIVDLFSGLRGWSDVWRNAGHEVFTVDLEAKFAPDLCADILEVDAYDFPWRPHVILASPPCTTFSVASISTHWTGGHRAYVPKTDEARLGIAIVRQTMRLVEDLGPRYWAVENPRGVLRKLGIMPVEPSVAWLCHYGDHRAKPTDIWHNTPWKVERVCHNQRPAHPPDCCCWDHEGARRGAKTGTQGLGTAAERAKIPWGLAQSVKDAILNVYQDEGGIPW